MRHVVVTGGGSGTGAQIAHRFAASGAKVTIMGRRAASLEKQGLAFEVCDVTRSSEVVSAFDRARAARGPITIVIANAGDALSKPFASMDDGDLNDMMAVNLNGVFNVWQAGLGDMKEAGWGRMIAIASTAGLKGYAYVSGYCAAKHAVVGLTRALAQELATTGITVNAICPGFIDTPLLDRSIANIMAKTGMTREDAGKALKAGNPQKRFIGVDEVADAALWLASETARSVNGHALALSGGEI